MKILLRMRNFAGPHGLFCHILGDKRQPMRDVADLESGVSANYIS